MADQQLGNKLDILAAQTDSVLQAATVRRAGKPGRGAAVQEDSEITPERFVIMLVEAEKRINASEGNASWKGCHWLYSGARKSFQAMFPTINDREITDAMVTAGKLFRYLGKGGPTFYLPEDWGKNRQRAEPGLDAKAAKLISMVRDALKK